MSSDSSPVSGRAQSGNALTRSSAAAWRKQMEAITGRSIATTGEVYLLVDCSGSMADKLQQAVDGAKGFSREAQRKNYRVGLIVFSNDARLLQAARQDVATLDQALANVNADGGTNMKAAIDLGVNHLLSVRGERVLCLVTDGQPGESDATIHAAESAKQQGISIMAIGVDGADQAFLAKITTRFELALKVTKQELQAGITSMARLLPGKIK